MVRALACLAAGAAALSGCVHSLPKGHFDALADRVCAGQVCYRMGALPAEWRVVHQQSAAIGFYSAELGAVIEANASCRDDAEATPLEALTRLLLIGYTDRNVRSQEKVPLDQREALRTQLDAKLDGVPMSLDLLVMKRNGCIFDLSYAAPPDRFDRGSNDFQRFVSGFADDRKSPASARAERADQGRAERSDDGARRNRGGS
jgi:hypothetical protein